MERRRGEGDQRGDGGGGVGVKGDGGRRQGNRSKKREKQKITNISVNILRIFSHVTEASACGTLQEHEVLRQ